ncbi:MAG: SDR family oxidoreductase [Chloroflexi bacterium]|nr:SDR family oxidoreductase [Chloroflexota bacterium]MCC6894030.1 SDR family oxidoreductase [Anaerolineae bacterium]
MADLQTKTALLIGKSLSTVAGITRELQAAGMEIVVGHTPEDAAAAAQITSRTAPLTLNDPAVLDAEIAAVGSIDIAIIAPAWFKAVRFLDSTLDDWDAALHGNFESSVYALRAVGKHLQAQGRGGSILVLSSVAALSAHKDLSVVATSLAALHVPARLAAVELAPHGITVNVVVMGWLPDAWSADYLNADSQPLLEQATPMGRLGTFADLASVCRLLASPDARYLTGVVLSVDGGYTLHKASTPAPR